MKAFRMNRWAVLAMTVTMFATKAQAMQSVPKHLIVVSLEDRKLALVEAGRVRKIYAVAVGKASTPSPEGVFSIERRVVNPTYHHQGKTVAPGAGNPVGTRWMGLSKQGYGIHGTNEPNSIGKAASHGCIRMARPDLEEFFEMVGVGDTVKIVGRRDDETAQMFGDGPLPVGMVTQQPALASAFELPKPSHSAEAAATSVAVAAPQPAVAAAGSR